MLWLVTDHLDSQTCPGSSLQGEHDTRRDRKGKGVKMLARVLTQVCPKVLNKLYPTLLLLPEFDVAVLACCD